MMTVIVYKLRPRMKFPLLAWLIMLCQGMMPWRKSSWSHFALGFRHPGFVAVDSTSKGVIFHDEPTSLLNKYKIIEARLVECGDFDLEEWRAEIEGRPYDTLQIFGLFLKALNIISFNSIGKNFRSMTCNEVVLHFLSKRYGVDFGDTDNYDLRMTWNAVKEYLK